MAVWQHVEVETREGVRVRAVAPLIISASRATDIPAFHSAWLLNRIEAGYCEWLNPFSRTVSVVSFDRARVFVFWTKNPAPLIPKLGEFDCRGRHYYFQFTLNDYEAEALEPGVPPLAERVRTFRELARLIGPARVVWRFDPLLISRTTPPEELLRRVVRLGNELHPFTQKLVFSFADVGGYRGVAGRLKKAGLGAREFSREEMREFARSLAPHARRWGLQLATCAEAEDLGRHGVAHNSCIDADLMIRCFSEDRALMEFLGAAGARRKDKGQRKACGCVASKDIGGYGTCPHLCLYCYAGWRHSQTGLPDSGTLVARRPAPIWQNHGSFPRDARLRSPAPS